MRCPLRQNVENTQNKTRFVLLSFVYSKYISHNISVRKTLIRRPKLRSKNQDEFDVPEKKVEKLLRLNQKFSPKSVIFSNAKLIEVTILGKKTVTFTNVRKRKRSDSTNF